MKKFSGVLLSLVLVLCVLLLLPIYAGAAGTQVQDGLEVTIETAKDVYEPAEEIRILIEIKNTNPFKVRDVSVETLLPKGMTVRTGTLSAQNVDIEGLDTYTVLGSALLPESVAEESGSNTTLIVVIIAAVVLVLAGVGIFFVIKFKKTPQTVCLLLCAAMLLSMCSLHAWAAETEHASVTVAKTVTVGGKEYQIQATVTYEQPALESAVPGEEKVPEDIAQLFGVNPNEYDSDEDGLSNYIEIYVTATDPTVPDTDGDGVSDKDEDADSDGLTNAEELELHTELTKADTDGDDLSDSRETKEIGTDPLQYDTDGDGISDGDELLLKLDPKKQKTDGVTPDAERVITQKLSASNIEEQLTAEENDAIPTLTLKTTGNANNRVVITATQSNHFGDSRAVIGEPVDIRGDNMGEGVLSFALKKVDAGFASGKGYNTTLICKYNEDGTTEYLETGYDEEYNAVFAKVSDEGTYFVLDVQNLFDELGIVLPDAPEDTGEEEMPEDSDTAVSDAEALEIVFETYETEAAEEEEESKTHVSPGAMAQADIIFLIDTTGSMSEEISNVKENVGYFVDALREKGISAGFALIDYQDIEADGYDSTKVHKNGTSNWFYDMDAYKDAISSLRLGHGGDAPECVVDALETGRLMDMRGSAGKIFILVTDADYKVANRYGIESLEQEIELLKNAGVTCAVVSRSSDRNSYFDLYDQTNGIWADIYGDFYEELMKLADKIGEEIVGDGYWIYLDGPVPVPIRLDAEPTEGSTVDTDGDGIPDIDELGGTISTREVDLDALITFVSQGAITDTDYGVVLMYKYGSSPAEADTDFDGIADAEDLKPNSNSFKGVLVNSFEEGVNVQFTMDYRKLVDDSNTKYSTKKSELASIFATLAYGGTIKITSGANTSGNASQMYKAVGLEDYANYSLKGMYEDDDISQVMIGHRLVAYNGTATEVFVVSVRGTNGTVEEWSSNFDVGAKDEVYWDYNNEEWVNPEHHKGFDVTANRCYALIMDYIKNGVLAGKISNTANKSIFITGHSRGAAISNLLGKMFEDDPDFISSTYGFATPNTTTAENASDYKTIFSVVNEDDLVPRLPLSSWGFTKYGTVKSASVEADYENRFMKAEEGTWEWFINANRSDGLDYNCNGNMSDTIKAFEKIVPTLRTATTQEIRKALYEKTGSSDSILMLGKTYESESAAQKDIVNLQNSYGKRLSRAAIFTVLETKEGLFKQKTVYKVGLKQSPEFLMMTLAALAGKDEPENDNLGDSLFGRSLGYRVASKYRNAKNEFVHSAIDSAGDDGEIFLNLGGMTHGHWPETYCLLAKYLK